MPAKLVFDQGISPGELAHFRAMFAALLLVLALAVVRPRALRVRRADLPLLALFGALGIAAINYLYYESISRLPIGVALVIQYTAPLLMLGLARLRGRSVGGRLWIAGLLTLGGCWLAVGAYDESLRNINAVGALFALASAFVFVAYFLMAERVLRLYEPWTALAYGLVFATLAWTIVRPPWLLPWDAAIAQWPLVVAVVFIATLFPYALTLAAVAVVPPARVALTATFEPVVGAIAAFLLLREVLEVPQLAGGALVLVGIGIAQSLRPQEGGV